MSKSLITISSENTKIIAFDCVTKYVNDVISKLTEDVNMTISKVSNLTATDLALLSVQATLTQDSYRDILSNILSYATIEEANTLTFTVDGKVHSTIDVSSLRCEEYKILHTLTDTIIKGDEANNDFPVISDTKS